MVDVSQTPPQPRYLPATRIKLLIKSPYICSCYGELLREALDYTKNQMREKMNETQKKDSVPHNVKTCFDESIAIIGDISGKADTVINGSVEGDIQFRDNEVIIGENGKIKADIIAKSIIVAGDVKGGLRASEQVTIKSSGRVAGDIHAPRVSLDNGCQFQGSVNTEETGNSKDERRSTLRLSKTPPSRAYPIKAKKPNTP